MDLMLLDTLRDKMVNGKEFADAFEYFMDHFGEDPEFMRLGKPARDPILERALVETMKRVLQDQVNLAKLTMVRLPDVGFIHGWFHVRKAVGAFFYFEEIHMGIAAVSAPQLGNNTLFSRFSGFPLGKTPPNPRRN